MKGLPKAAYFLGIGGIGMSAIARYMHEKGVLVCGYDKTESPITSALQASGIQIDFDEDSAILQERLKTRPDSEWLIILTPAIPKDHRGFEWLRQNNFIIKKRSEVLAQLANLNQCIAVAGTHGKTTTSSIIAHILKDSGHGCQAFLGGIMSNYDSNLISDDSSQTVVVEADEFDRSFLTLFPHIAVITSMDADHLDIYDDKSNLNTAFNEFASQITEDGILIYNEKTEPKFDGKSFKYGMLDDCDYQAKHVHVKNGKFIFDLETPSQSITGLELSLPGRHNVENATAALAIGEILGLDSASLKQSLANYRGVKRRFEIHISRDEFVYIDDYAHHPTELDAAIDASRELFPNKKLTGIFQPHLFSRTKDFADEFAASLSKLDEIILLPIYPAREIPIPGVDSQMLLDKIPNTHKKLVAKSDLLHHLSVSKPQVLLTLGAGDIDRFVDPIRLAFE